MNTVNRKLLVAGLIAIVAMVILLRVFNLGHSLTYDEAWNANSVMDSATGHTNDVFYNNFLRHPPLYTGLGALYAAVCGTGRYGLSIAMEIMSIAFAAGLALAIFFCGRDWFGERAGLAAAFLFAVMPAARAYDSLVKQESLALLLGMLFLLLFFRGQFLLAGAMLGMAMLTKEIFVFLPAALFLFLLSSRGFSQLKGFFTSLAVGVLMSSWWYLFFSSSKGEFARFYLGRSLESANWRKPWHFYVGRLSLDIGWVTLALSFIGAVFLVTYIRRNGWPRGVSRAPVAAVSPPAQVDARQPHWRIALFLVIWILLIYMFLSLSWGKPPWLIYSTLPAFALLGGWGLAEMARVLSAHPMRARAVLTAALAAALALSLPVGFGSFLLRADASYRRSMTYKDVALYMNARMSSSGRVLLRVNDLSPNLAFYLKSYRPDSLFVLPKEPGGGEEKDIEPSHTVLVLLGEAGTEAVIEQIAFTRPDFVMMRPGFKSSDGSDPAPGLARYETPVDIDGVWVFDGRKLREALAPAANH